MKCWLLFFSYGEDFHMKMLVKIWNIFADVLLVIALLLVFAFVGAKFIGYTPYVVTSGSMQSIYPVGSIIYVKDAEPQDVQVGDAITFYLSGDTVASHQITRCGQVFDLPSTVSLFFGIRNI
jgi:signal peptidase I